jgi:hypothetical protein
MSPLSLAYSSSPLKWLANDFSSRSLSFSITASSSAGGRSYLAEAASTPLATTWQYSGVHLAERQRTRSLIAHRVWARQGSLGIAGRGAATGAGGPTCTGTLAAGALAVAAGGASSAGGVAAWACRPGRTMTPARAATAWRRAILSGANCTKSLKRCFGEVGELRFSACLVRSRPTRGSRRAAVRPRKEPFLRVAVKAVNRKVARGRSASRGHARGTGEVREIP